jgi:hypothetical protein
VLAESGTVEIEARDEVEERISRQGDFASLECQAGIAQLVEHELPKLGVAGSNPVSRSILSKVCDDR